MNETFFSKVRMAVSLLAHRSVQWSSVFVRGNHDRLQQHKIKASAFALLLCLAGTFTIQADASQTDDLDQAISSVKTQVNQLSLDDAQAFADFKASVANLNGLLTATNETQSVLLAAGIVTGPAGFVADIPVTIIPGKFQPTAIQADVLLPSGVTFVSAAVGPASTAAGKSIQTAVITGGIRILIFGLNQTPILKGVVATLIVTLGPNKTSYPIPMTNPVASDGAGNSLPMCVTSGIVRGN